MLSLQRLRQNRHAQIQHWFVLGAGLCIWLAMQVATLLGGLFGAQIPPSWHLEVVAPLALLGLLVLSLTSWAGVAAALAAGGTALLLAGLPLNLGLVVATGVGLGVAQPWNACPGPAGSGSHDGLDAVGPSSWRSAWSPMPCVLPSS